MITIVSGLPRSGTSLMMQMLHAAKLPVLTDEQRKADDDNPRGYFEFEDVKRLDRNNAWIAQAEGKVVKIVSQFLVNLPAGHEYRVIFMRRELSEVLKSQQAMLDRRGTKGADVPPEKLAEAFRRHLGKVEAWLAGQKNVRTLYVPYADAIRDPMTWAGKVNEFLGGSFDVKAMAAAVDPKLYRNRG